MTDDVPLAAIEQARRRIAPYVRRTPLLPPPLLHADAPAGLRMSWHQGRLARSQDGRRCRA